MNITKREKRMLVVVGILLVITGIYYFLYRPALTEVEDLFAQIDNEQQKLLGLIAMSEKIESLRQEIALIESTLEDELKVLPEISDEPGLVKHLHNMFVPFGGLRSIHIEDPASRGEFSGVGVKLSYNLNYKELYYILLALEKSPYRNRIDSFAVHSAQEGDGNETQDITVNMSLTFYFSN